MRQKARKGCRCTVYAAEAVHTTVHPSGFCSPVPVNLALRRAEKSANPPNKPRDREGNGVGVGGMSLLNAPSQPMHANAYLTGSQAPSFTTPEPVDLSSPRPIVSLRLPPVPANHPRLDGVPELFDGQRRPTFYQPPHDDIERRPFALNSHASIGSRIGSDNNYDEYANRDGNRY